AMYIVEMFNELKCKIEVPPHPKTSMSFQFANFEFYGYIPMVAGWEKWKTDTTLPIEFDKIPADFHIWYWNLLDRTPAIYEKVAEYFSVCAPWEHKQSSKCENSNIPHSIHGHPCVNGAFDLKKCEIFTCEEGYYLNEDKTKCLEVAPLDKTKIKKLEDVIVSLRRKRITAIVLNVLDVLAVIALFIVSIVVNYFVVIRRKRLQ